jgi:hypothetical protein
LATANEANNGTVAAGSNEGAGGDTDRASGQGKSLHTENIDGTTLLLRALGFSPEELFLGNLMLLAGELVAVSVLHKLLVVCLLRRGNAKRQKAYDEKLLELKHQQTKGGPTKKTIPDAPVPYTVPRALQFPRAEVAFLTIGAMGFCQSSLVVLTDASALAWVRMIACLSILTIPAFALFVLTRLVKVRRQVQSVNRLYY